MHWQMQRAFRFTTRLLLICCPGSNSLTKKSLVTSERCRAKVRQQRAEWFAHRLPASGQHPDRVVLVLFGTLLRNTLPANGRNHRENQFHPPARTARARPTADDGRVIWQLGNPDVDRQTEPRRPVRAVGHQGRNE